MLRSITLAPSKLIDRTTSQKGAQVRGLSRPTSYAFEEVNLLARDQRPFNPEPQKVRLPLSVDEPNEAIIVAADTSQ